jgi:betaine-aldehyde dehydrogenase
MNIHIKASHFVNGEFVEDTSGAPIEFVYPATGEAVGRLHEATPEIIERALASAKAVQGEMGGHAPCRAEQHPVSRPITDPRPPRDIALADTIDKGRATTKTSHDAYAVANALELHGGVI